MKTGLRITFTLILLAGLAGSAGIVQARQDALHPLEAPHPAEAADPTARQAASPQLETPLAAVIAGRPGVSYAYAQTYGVSETGYPGNSFYLNEPLGIDARGDHVWIVEQFGLRALKFSSFGAFLGQIGKAGFRHGANSEFENLRDVAEDANGNIWIVEGSAAYVAQYTASGEWLRDLGQRWKSGSANNQFRFPNGIAFDSADNIYVCDASNQRIQVFQPDGTYLATLGQTGVIGADNDHFYNPRHITIFEDLLYVADSLNQRVQIFDVSDPLNMTYVATMGVTGEPGSDNTRFDYPYGVAVDNTRILVADASNHRVQVFTKTFRTYIATLGVTNEPGATANHFNFPTDVATDNAGNVYVADNNNLRVRQFNNSLIYQRTYGTTGVPYTTNDYLYFRPAGVAVNSVGEVFLVEEWG